MLSSDTQNSWFCLFELVIYVLKRRWRQFNSKTTSSIFCRKINFSKLFRRNWNYIDWNHSMQQIVGPEHFLEGYRGSIDTTAWLPKIALCMSYGAHCILFSQSKKHFMRCPYYHCIRNRLTPCESLDPGKISLRQPNALRGTRFRQQLSRKLFPWLLAVFLPQARYASNQP